MPTPSRRRVGPAVALTASCLLLAACGSDTTAATGGLTQDQLTAIADGIAAEVEGTVGFMTTFEVSHPSASERRVAGALIQASLAGGRLHGVNAATAPAGCPTFVPDPPADADHDGVPDTATLSFTLPACQATDSSGFVLEVTGTVQLADPTPADSDLSSSGRATDFVLRFLDATGKEQLATTRDGVWTTTAQALGITETSQMRTGVALGGVPAVQVTSDWTTTLTPSAHETLFMGAQPPAGAVNVTGTVTVNDGLDAFTLDLTTPIALQFDPIGCRGQTTSFTGGEITGTFSGSGNPAGTVRIDWANCGSPSATFVRN